jgi:hypothetical protein
MYIPGFNDEQHRAQVYMCDRLPDTAAPLTAVEGVCRPQAPPPAYERTVGGYSYGGYSGYGSYIGSRRSLQHITDDRHGDDQELTIGQDDLAASTFGSLKVDSVLV